MDEQVLAAFQKLVELLLCPDESSHVQVERDGIAVVQVSLPERKDHLEQSRSHLELQIHGVGEIRHCRELLRLRGH